MRTLIVYYSHTGNNRLLAEYLAQRTGATLEAVTETRHRGWLTILADMMFRREPPIRPLSCSTHDFDYVLLVAPVWGAQVAHPMKTLIKSERGNLATYAFISLCGYTRPDQQGALEKELAGLAGHPPQVLEQLPLSELFPADKRNDVRTITRYRATRADLDVFLPRIDAFLEHIESADMPLHTASFRPQSAAGPEQRAP